MSLQNRELENRIWNYLASIYPRSESREVLARRFGGARDAAIACLRMWSRGEIDRHVTFTGITRYSIPPPRNAEGDIDFVEDIEEIGR